MSSTTWLYLVSCAVACPDVWVQISLDLLMLAVRACVEPQFSINRELATAFSEVQSPKWSWNSCWACLSMDFISRDLAQHRSYTSVLSQPEPSEGNKSWLPPQEFLNDLVQCFWTLLPWCITCCLSSEVYHKYLVMTSLSVISRFRDCNRSFQVQ